MVDVRQFARAGGLMVAMCFATSSEAAILFSENFRTPSAPGVEGETPCVSGVGAGNYQFATGWLLRNVDNWTPSGSVNWVNEAWEINAEPVGNQSNCVAFSTSFYLQVADANDFMWTPAIALPAAAPDHNLGLRWRARNHSFSIRDGYEVRVMLADAGPPSGGTSDLGNQLANSTQIFSVSAEEFEWTARSVSLDAYAGQTIYIGFRNASFDRYLLGVDDVVVETLVANLAVGSPQRLLPYSRVSSDFAYAPTLGAEVINVGARPLSSITASAQLLHNGQAIGAPILADPVPNLALGASTPLVFAGNLGVMNRPGSWSVRYTVSAAESEASADLIDNQIDSDALVIGGDELARHQGASSFDLGIGQGEGGEFGVQFSIPNAVTFHGVRFAMGPKSPVVDTGMGFRDSSWAGQSLIASVRDYDTLNQEPGDTVIATTVAGIAQFAPRSYELAFSTGPLTLPAGTYVVTINEPVPLDFPIDGTLAIPMHADRYESGTTWMKWPSGGDWIHPDSLSTDYAKSPAISLLAEALFKDGME